MDELVRWLGAEAHENARWMGWNTLLALVPAAIALLLFRPGFRSGRRPGPAWWVGATLFLLFLPNAPYVLTDVVHLVADVREESSDAVVLAGVLPVYGAFFATGLGAYVLCLRRISRFLVEHGWDPPRRVAAELVLHGVSAVGIYLGRGPRLSSWDAVLDPARTMSGLGGLLRPVPLAATVAVFAGLLVATAVVRVLLDATAELAHRHLGPLRPA
ncbi:MAG: DUF1361 domain-containing protein [Acidimicrobiia bacterium]|nr:DUF1361 domain-containing protein [Acidimicrobiia bacterium]